MSQRGHEGKIEGQRYYPYVSTHVSSSRSRVPVPRLEYKRASDHYEQQYNTMQSSMQNKLRGPMRKFTDSHVEIPMKTRVALQRSMHGAIIGHQQYNMGLPVQRFPYRNFTRNDTKKRGFQSDSARGRRVDHSYLSSQGNPKRLRALGKKKPRIVRLSASPGESNHAAPSHAVSYFTKQVFT
eukprot:CAMPEP_0184488780 /NCGR_PEP_ID=MMETSP0113_2-20130426/13409_1 /TAXON_ID=91329 /ORGANISM="Norrisiella sphaerica, Strain BC52" /LENGTH=181 /DNA_ID=CAMNT_0026871803 /DNA_START=309 /DNA_END=854 /DNA_ORIENTATION=+